MNNARFTFFLLLLLIVTPLSSQETYKPVNDINEFKSRLSGMSASTLSIAADFIQEKNLSVLSDKIISKGKFYFKKENNIRWEYTEPYKYLIIISNNQLFTKDEKGQKQYDIQSNKMFQEMNKFITGCINGDILKNTKDYKIEYYENPHKYYVKLIPYSEKVKQMLNEVHIYFDKANLSVDGIKMVETEGDYTKIDFVNKKMNIEIPVEKFNFK